MRRIPRRLAARPAGAVVALLAAIALAGCASSAGNRPITGLGSAPQATVTVTMAGAPASVPTSPPTATHDPGPAPSPHPSRVPTFDPPVPGSPPATSGSASFTPGGKGGPPTLNPTGVIHSDYAVTPIAQCSWERLPDGTTIIFGSFLFSYKGTLDKAPIDWFTTDDVENQYYHGLVKVSYFNGSSSYYGGGGVGRPGFDDYLGLSVILTMTIYPQGFDTDPSNNRASVIMKVPATPLDPGSHEALPCKAL